MMQPPIDTKEKKCGNCGDFDNCSSILGYLDDHEICEVFWIK